MVPEPAPEELRSYMPQVLEQEQVPELCNRKTLLRLLEHSSTLTESCDSRDDQKKAELKRFR